MKCQLERVRIEPMGNRSTKYPIQIKIIWEILGGNIYQQTLTINIITIYFVSIFCSLLHWYVKQNDKNSSSTFIIHSCLILLVQQNFTNWHCILQKKMLISLYPNLVLQMKPCTTYDSEIMNKVFIRLPKTQTMHLMHTDELQIWLQNHKPGAYVTNAKSLLAKSF